jgi:hypothetical protein
VPPATLRIADGFDLIAAFYPIQALVGRGYPFRVHAVSDGPAVSADRVMATLLSEAKGMSCN